MLIPVVKGLISHCRCQVALQLLRGSSGPIWQRSQHWNSYCRVHDAVERRWYNNPMTEAANSNADYRSAVLALNRLQSNAATLDQSLRERDARCGDKIPEMVRLAARLGITPEDYNSLRVVHITGTKGKGGTAAYVESILRSHGYRTGFFSSPHLVEVRERIRINGQSISQASFAQYFWRTHDRLTQTPGPDPLPPYFSFLTLVAIGVFLEERVDVAVMEVGIGGRYDNTNFVTAPWVCAISSLGFDHTALLGNTISQIASQKAGILKPGCVGVTVEGQPEDGMAALMAEADLVACPLLVAPHISDFPDAPDWLAERLAPSQLCNASLAAAVCKIWLERKRIEDSCSGDGGSKNSEIPAGIINLKQADVLNQLINTLPIPQPFLDGIQSARWPGRNTVISLPGGRNSTTLYIDGAHTVESVTKTADWFRGCTANSARPLVLIFNRTGDRKAVDLLGPLLAGVSFQAALFTPNAVVNLEHHSDELPDLANVSISQELAATRVAENLAAFRLLIDGSNSSCECSALNSVSEAVDWLVKYDSRVGGCEVLVTGSLHLIGCLFALIAPNIATGLD